MGAKYHAFCNSHLDKPAIFVDCLSFIRKEVWDNGQKMTRLFLAIDKIKVGDPIAPSLIHGFEMRTNGVQFLKPTLPMWRFCRWQ